MPAGNTYTAIATQTLGSAASSVTFSSISGAYTDLVLVISGYITAGTVGVFLQFNTDTTTNYSTTYLYGDGSSASSTRASTQIYTQIGNMSDNAQVTQIAQIMNYSNSTTYKTVLSRYNNTVNSVGATVGLWKATPAAITSVKILTNSSTFISGSTFTLYGIAAA